MRHRGKSGIPGLCILLVSLLSAGCEQGGMAELGTYIEQIKSRPAGVIEPLPEIAPVDSFVFEPIGRRDPFVMDRQTTAAVNPDNGLAPDPKRPKEQLESYPLTDLAMVGTLGQDETLWALVRNKEGLIFRAQVGNYLGLNNGQIVEISPDFIRLMEIVADAPGEWRESPQTIPLRKP